MRTFNRMNRKSLRKDETGTALIELAIMLPFLMLLVFGAIDFSRVFYASVELGNAVTAGAEYGARTTSTATDTSGMAAMVTADAANLSGVVVNSPSPASYCTCPDAPATHISCTTSCAV